MIWLVLYGVECDDIAWLLVWMVRFTIVWYVLVWCNAIWYGMTWYGMVGYGTS